MQNKVITAYVPGLRVTFFYYKLFIWYGAKYRTILPLPNRFVQTIEISKVNTFKSFAYK